MMWHYGGNLLRYGPYMGHNIIETPGQYSKYKSFSKAVATMHDKFLDPNVLGPCLKWSFGESNFRYYLEFHRQHVPFSLYSLLDAPFSTELSQIIPFPSFYGILFFNQAVDSNVTIYSPSTNQSLFKAWATQHENMNHLVLLNKQNQQQSVQVILNPLEGMIPSNVTLTSLTSDKLESTNGTLLGGQWLNEEAEWKGESTVISQSIDQKSMNLTLPAYSGLLVRITYQSLSNQDSMTPGTSRISIGAYVGIGISLSILFAGSFLMYRKFRVLKKGKTGVFIDSI
jgi:hypothetical protein